MEQKQTLPLFQMDKDSLKALLKELIQASLSIAIGQVIQHILLTINLSFAGILNNDHIQSGIGLANVVINCTGSILVLGLNQGFGSLAARAKGAKDNKLLKNYFIKQVITMYCVIFILGVSLMLIDKILIWLGQKEEIVYYAQMYSLQIFFGLSCYFTFDLLRNYMNAIGYFQLPMLIQLAGIILQYIQCFLYSSVFPLGYIGIVIATTVSQFTQLLALMFALNRIESSFFVSVVSNLNSSVLINEFTPYLRYVFPFALPLVIEMFSFEINSIFAGTIQNDSYFSAHIILCSIINIFYSFPSGLGSAVCSLSSRALGQSNAQGVKNYYHLCLILGTLLGLFFLIVFLLFDIALANFYTHSQEVIDHFIQITIMYRFFIIVDNLQVAIQGSLKSLGKGKLVLQFFVFSYYLIGTPLSYAFGFVLDYKLQGLWLGFYLGILSVFILMIVALRKINWEQVVTEQYYKFRSTSIEEISDNEMQLQFIH